MWVKPAGGGSMRLAFRPIVILATATVMVVIAGCGGKQMKLVVERETVIHDPVIQSVSFEGPGRVDRSHFLTP